MRKMIVTGACALMVSNFATAQFPQSIFNAVRNRTSAVIQNQPSSAQSQNPATAILGAAPALSTELAPATGLGAKYGTKQALLDGARNGELAGYANLPGNGTDESKSLVYAIGLILAKEYGTPIPNWDERNRFAGGNRRNGDCYAPHVKADIHLLLQAVTREKISTLSDRPPDFTIPPTGKGHQSVNEIFQRINTYCYTELLGVRQSYPFVQSLSQLLADYAKASEDFVTARRAQYVEQYQQALSQKLADEQKRAEVIQRLEAERRELEQKEIDAQRRRVQEEELKVKERERNRVAG